MKSAPLFRSNFRKYTKISRALVARIILLLHACLAIVMSAAIDTRFYALLVIPVITFAVETGLILHYKCGLEWKRFCTAFLCYLISIVPALWIQRLHVHDQDTQNSTSTLSPNSTNSTASDSQNGGSSLFNKIGVDDENKLLSAVIEQGAASLLEQSMMFIIILCRWLLPRGRIDRNSLSQLLLMYSAGSADILDFSEIFDNEAIQSDVGFKFAILGVWSWSLLQFTLVVTNSFLMQKQPREHDIEALSNSNKKNADRSDDMAEILSILMVFLMQDGPFFVARCYAIFVVHVVDYLIIFFALKNALTLILGIFRLLVLWGCITKDGNDLLRKSEIARSMEMLAVNPPPRGKSKKKGRKQKF